MGKQVLITMGDFKQIEKTEKMLDRAFYKLELLSADIKDDEVSKKMEFIFKDLGNCVEALRNVIK